MAEYVTLLGAEDVRNAASRIASAADQISRAASSMSATADRSIRMLDDMVSRLEALATTEKREDADFPAKEPEHE